MYPCLMVGILGLSVMTLTACQSMTGKTAGRNHRRRHDDRLGSRKVNE